MRYNLGLSVRYENKAHELTKACDKVMMKIIQAFIWSNSSQIKPTVHAFDMGSADFPVFKGRSRPVSFSDNLFAIIAEPWPCLYSTLSGSEKQAKRVCSLAHKSKNSVLLDLNFTKVYTNATMLVMIIILFTLHLIAFTNKYYTAFLFIRPSIHPS